MTTKKILSIYDFGNYIVKKETEKAYLIESTCTGNSDTWFPKSAFTPTRHPLTNIPYEDTFRADGAVCVYLDLKDWFYKKLSPEQYAVLRELKVA